MLKIVPISYSQLPPDDYYDDEYYDDDDGYVPPPKPKPKPAPKKQPSKAQTPQKAKIPSKQTPKKDNTTALSKKLAKINISEELDKRFESEKPVLYMVVIGHVDAGKSTLVGQLSLGCGNLSSRDAGKLENQAELIGKPSFGLAFMMDQTETERERGVTIEVGNAKFIELRKLQLALLDAPGHKDFVPAMIKNGACGCDCAMVIIDASVGKFEAGFTKGGQTREHIYLTRGLGCTRLIVAVNKLDTVGFDQNRFEEIKSQMIDFLKHVGFSPKDVDFVPISGLTGIGVSKPFTGDASWFKGKNLFEIFELIPIPDRTALRARPLRASVTETSEDSKGLMMRVRIECGSLAAGSKVRVAPSLEDALVTEIIEPPLKAATVGDIVDVRLSGVELEQVAPVSLLCSYDLALPKSQRIRCHVKMISFKSKIPITPGLPITFYSRGNATSGHIKRINALLDRNGAVSRLKPRVVKSGDLVELEVLLASAICIETFADVKELSRVVLRYGSETIAIGKTIKVL